MHTYVENKCVYRGKGPSVDTVRVHYINVLNVNMIIYTYVPLCVYVRI